MLFNVKAMLIAALALLFTGQVMGEAQIATNPGMLPFHLIPPSRGLTDSMYRSGRLQLSQQLQLQGGPQLQVLCRAI